MAGRRHVGAIADVGGHLGGERGPPAQVGQRLPGVGARGPCGAPRSALGLLELAERPVVAHPARLIWVRQPSRRPLLAVQRHHALPRSRPADQVRRPGRATHALPGGPRSPTRRSSRSPGGRWVRRSSSFPATRRSLPFCPRPRGRPGALRRVRFPWFVPHRTNHPLAMGAVLRWNGSRPSSVGPPVDALSPMHDHRPKNAPPQRNAPCLPLRVGLAGPVGPPWRDDPDAGDSGASGDCTLRRPDDLHPKSHPETNRAQNDETPRALCPRGLVNRNPGGDLLSQGASPQVPSARAGLTAVFGMGTGVSPPPWPPETVRSAGRPTPAGTAAHLRAASPQTLSVPKRARAK